MRFATGRLAAAGARHPWRMLGAWTAVAVLAVIVIVVFLPGSLTTEGAPTNSPESERADEAAEAAFPSDPSTDVTDVVVIRSEEYTVGAPQFEAYVTRFTGDGGITALGLARTYLDDGGEALVSEDRHATVIPVAL